jgi:predicted small metal-binding protein
MKKYLIWLILLAISIGWVFAYHNISQSPEELLSDYVFLHCWETEFGCTQKITYQNYKQIWKKICSHSKQNISKEDLKEILNFINSIKNELKGL